MKISFSSSFGYFGIQKNNNKTQKQIVANPNQYNEFQKKSPTELLGRIQTISFGAVDKHQKSIFQHTFQEKFGFDKKDVITYDKQNGNLKHEIYDDYGKLKQIEEFSPVDNSEIQTIFLDNGAKTVKVTNIAFELFEKYDEKGRKTYTERLVFNKNRLTTEYDYEKNRIIKTSQNSPDAPKKVQVFDMKTNLEVHSGELVTDEEYDKKTNTYITKNIITNLILEKKQIKPNGISIRLIYSGKGSNNLTKEIISTADKRKEQVLEYEQDGITVKSNILHIKDEDGKLNSKIAYIGRTQKIKYKENYSNNYYTRTFYGEEPNVPQSKNTYNIKDKSLISKVIFCADGKRKYQIETYNKDSSFRRETLNYRGIKVKVEYIEADGSLGAIAEYDTQTGALKRTEKYNKNKSIKEETCFHKDGKTPLTKKTFNADGSYTQTKYKPDGTVESTEEYNKYGHKKANNNKTNWNWDYKQYYDYKQQFGDFSKTAQPTCSATQIENDTDFIDRLSEITAKQGFTLNDFDWDRLSKLVNVSDIQVIKNMDKATYRTLSKQFHPDLNLNKSQEEQIKAEKLFRIIQGIYTQ